MKQNQSQHLRNKNNYLGNTGTNSETYEVQPSYPPDQSNPYPYNLNTDLYLEPYLIDSSQSTSQPSVQQPTMKSLQSSIHPSLPPIGSQHYTDLSSQRYFPPSISAVPVPNVSNSTTNQFHLFSQHYNQPLQSNDLTILTQATSTAQVLPNREIYGSQLQSQKPLPASKIPNYSIEEPLQSYSNMDHQSYTDITSYVNSNPKALAPEVIAYFDDQVTCRICGRSNFINLKRHLKIHEQSQKYKCRFPKSVCNYKTNSYNRSFDFKRHLINKHFILDDKKAKKLPSLSAKFHLRGKCPCGFETTVKEWLYNHILTENESDRCFLFN